MWLIITLVIVGVLLLVTEMVLLPGLSIAGVGALISYGAAIYLGFTNYGNTCGIIVSASVAAVSLIAIVISLRAKTWQRLSLNNKIESTSQPLPEHGVSVGDRGIAITRLAPMGKVIINGNTYEAKSFGDTYVDSKKEVEVVGFENFSVIVKTL